MSEISKSQYELLTLGETANLLKVSTFTLKRWLKSGKIKGCKLPGNRWRIFKCSYLDIIERGKNV